MPGLQKECYYTEFLNVLWEILDAVVQCSWFIEDER